MKRVITAIYCLISAISAISVRVTIIFHTSVLSAHIRLTNCISFKSFSCGREREICSSTAIEPNAANGME